jgi:hypothetical protein
MVETADNVKMKNICEKYGFDFGEVKVIPFSGMVPDHDPSIPTIFYGGCGWINNIYTKYPDHKGIFFNPESVFTYWVGKYGKAALNYGATETTFNKISQESYPDDERFFIRPVSDLKEFSGGVMKFGDIKQWCTKIFTDVPDFGNVPIIIGEPYGLAYEWRLFLLNGKVITGSHNSAGFYASDLETLMCEVSKHVEELYEL